MYLNYRLNDKWAETPDTIDIMPERAHKNDAGLDLKAAHDITIQWGSMALVDTGFSVQIPPGFMGLLVPRSSSPSRGHTIANSPGIIDSDYRGSIKVAILAKQQKVEHFTLPFVDIKRGDRIAQLILVPIAIPNLVDCSIMSDSVWNETTRGTGGFGSSGV